MATTTNYSWSTPDDTALVKDGAAAIRTLGSSIDTTTKALNPSTTLGDIEYRSSTANTNTRLGIGSTGQVLTVSGGVPAWATVGGAGKTWTLLSTTSMSGSSSVTVSGISDKEDLLILVVGATFGSSNKTVRLRINGDTGSNYNVQQSTISPTSTYSDDAFQGFNSTATYVPLATTSTNTASQANASIVLSGCKSTGIKNVDYTAGATEAGGTDHVMNWGQGIYSASAAVTNITVFNSLSYAFTAGTIYIYGA